MNIRLFPVAWLTGAAVVAGAVLEADREFHLLPGSWGHWLGFVALALGLIIAGTQTHNAVTPLASPKDNAGVPLVPVTMTPATVTAVVTAVDPYVGDDTEEWTPKHLGADD